jgi:hypothetical protein
VIISQVIGAGFLSIVNYFFGSSKGAGLASVQNQSGSTFKAFGTLTDTVRGGCLGW